VLGWLGDVSAEAPPLSGAADEHLPIHSCPGATMEAAAGGSPAAGGRVLVHQPPGPLWARKTAHSRDVPCPPVRKVTEPGQSGMPRLPE
jgi:hypothetical protein